MTVSLRIVGIYYRQDGIPFKKGMTVMDVLDYALTTPAPNAKSFGFQTGRLKFGPDKGKLSISSFFADYENGFQSETSGMMKHPGTYYLDEDTSSAPAFTAWQYYVFDKPLQDGGAVYQVNSPRVESFENATVPDGGFVTWRLCKILAGPNPMPPNKMSAAQKLMS